MKKLLCTLILMLTGCAINVKLDSDPPGATLLFSDGQRKVPVIYEIPWTDEYRSGGCMTTRTPIAIWPDGTRSESFNLKFCKSSNINVFQYIIKKPESKLIPNTPSTVNISPPSSPPSINYQINIDDAKKKCSDLGFKSGTEGFGKCVLQLSK